MSRVLKDIELIYLKGIIRLIYDLVPGTGLEPAHNCLY